MFSDLVGSTELARARNRPAGAAVRRGRAAPRVPPAALSQVETKLPKIKWFREWLLDELAASPM
jgi:hypothetical protein